MSKRLATSIMRTLLFAALILTGWSVQASQVSPAENVQLHEQNMNASVDMNAGDEMTANGMASPMDMNEDCSLADGEMNMQNCLSACGGCPAVTASVLPVLASASTLFSENLPLTAVAAQYPIDHPPKQ